MAKGVVVLSGGLDSTVALYKWHATVGNTITSAVSFNYGQKHKKELDFAAATAKRLGIKHHIIDLWSSGLTEALNVPNGSSLIITDVDVPDGHYAEDSMKATVVPNRNMIMFSIAGAIAAAEGANVIVTGVHSGDHFIYPDCRSGFVGAAALALYLGNEEMSQLWRAPIWAPFLHKSKIEIARIALYSGIPFEYTWSCYKGGDVHCGRCGTCVERLEAINAAIAELNYGEDHTVYKDPLFWKTVIK